MASKKRGTAGRPYGHVPGRDFLDVVVEVRRRGLVHARITWGSNQGYREVHDDSE